MALSVTQNAAVTRWAQDARIASARYHIPVNVLLADIQEESGGHEGETSPTGAGGLTQFEPGTAKSYDVNVAPGHALSQILGQAHYLEDLGFAKNPTKALASYNAGPGNPAAGMGYARTVLALAKNYEGVAAPAAIPGAKVTTTTTTTAKPSAAFLADRGAVIRNFLFSNQGPVDFATQIKALGSPPSTSSVAKVTKVKAPSAKQTSAANTSATGTVDFTGKPVAAWIEPVLAYARSKGWKGTVTSGFRSLADQTAIYNSGVRPAAKPGTSNHEFTAFPGGAVDVTNAQQLSQILLGSKYAKLLVYAGAKDPVHFSHPHNGSY